jgi:hypothetical protein
VTLDNARFTWQEVIPSIFRCADKIRLEVFCIFDLVPRIAEGEGVGCGEDGVADAAEKFINFA